MHINGMLKDLRRQSALGVIVVAQIALTYAVITNTVSLIDYRLSKMRIDSGIPSETTLVVVERVGLPSDVPDGPTVVEDVERVRSIPGVLDATVGNQIPFGSRSRTEDITSKHSGREIQGSAAVYWGGPKLVEVLGLSVVSGRGFVSEEFLGVDSSNNPAASVCLVSSELADLLYPNQEPIGKQLWFSDHRGVTVVGVFSRFPKPYPSSAADDAYSVVLPVATADFKAPLIFARVDLESRQRIVLDLPSVLKGSNSGTSSVRAETIRHMRERYFRRDKALASALAVTTALVMLACAVGMGSVSAYWVDQRRRRIGICRALGASGGYVRAYLQIENFFVISGAALVGAVIAVAFNYWLRTRLETPGLATPYFVYAVAALWLVGQLVVFTSARRAAQFSPAEAMRSN